MSYVNVVDLLTRRDEEATVTVFPDGSVDSYYTVRGTGGDAIESRIEFGERIVNGAIDAFQIERIVSEPGGRAVNIAQQADALADTVTLFGHLNDSVFDDLAFETISMGTPTQVSIYDFDEDLMLAENSNDIIDWSLDDLRSAVDSLDTVLNADAICCTNWASVDAMNDAIAELAAMDFDGGVFVIDPGNLTVRSRKDVRELFDVLGTLEATTSVVFSANRAELQYCADSLSLDRESDAELVSVLCAEARLTGVVLHEVEQAVAGTDDDKVTVSNLEVDDPQRQTGAGDRFSAGLLHALVREEEWELALALGNTCASYYVEHNKTGTRDDLVTYLQNRDCG